MNQRFIIHDLKSNIKQWIRNKGTVFWTLLFPVLLILLFGAIFSESDKIEFDLVIQDLDKSVISEEFLKSFNLVTVLNIDRIENNIDIMDYIQEYDKSAGLLIPEGFGENLSNYLYSKQNQFSEINDTEPSFNLTLIVDPSDQSTVSVMRNIIYSIINEFNMNITEGKKIISIDEVSSIGDDFRFIDFLIPGIIGLTIMTSSIYGSIERNTKFRKNGILRKLLTMPIGRADWILSKMLFMLFLSFISTFVILLVGILFWGITIKINIYFFIIIISTSFLFSGIGMIIGRFVKDEETADVAGGAITFPMMFLAGTFFPLEQMPDFLNTIAQFLPLYYVNEGLRNAMIYADSYKALYFSFFTVAFAIFFFMLGIVLTKWKES
jgi:ABC-2 type transport system permease protein